MPQSLTWVGGASDQVRVRQRLGKVAVTDRLLGRARVPFDGQCGFSRKRPQGSTDAQRRGEEEHAEGVFHPINSLPKALGIVDAQARTSTRLTCPAANSAATSRSDP